MKNKFKIVIPSYNNEKWVETNIESILEQEYDNYEVLYIDDCSTDNTLQKVKTLTKNNKKWNIVSNEKNMKRGYNISPINKNIQKFMNNDEDILIFVDGDDWLASSDVLTKLNNFYNDKQCWMSYGGMVCWKGGEEINEANPQNSSYSYDVHISKNYRKDLWRASHLRTFKWWLYKKIKDEDLRYSKTNNYYFHAEDLATSYPCLEMSGIDKIGVHDFVTYVFNEFPSNRARGVERENQAGVELESEIRNSTPYKTISYDNKISCEIFGYTGYETPNYGLGNQLFCIAATLGLAYDNNSKPVFKMDYQQKPYIDTIFSKLIKDDNFKVEKIHKQNGFHYEEIPYENGLYISGLFQSEKYFINQRKKILDLLGPHDIVKKTLRKKFSHVFNNDCEVVSIHIRRGDYISLQSHHALLDLDYYQKSISKFNDEKYKFLVFSDDINWCKKNFSNEFNFVERGKDYMDMWLMSLCNHNIIANSSFSWWGAWLNANENKKVIAPKKWFGPSLSEYNTNDLIPTTWEII